MDLSWFILYCINAILRYDEIKKYLAAGDCAIEHKGANPLAPNTAQQPPATDAETEYIFKHDARPRDR